MSRTSPSHMALFALLLATAVFTQRTRAAEPLLIRFPNDPAVLDAKRDFGAKGDGVADDTEALQKALDASSGTEGRPSKVLFLPNGTYRVTKTLIIGVSRGPWLYGETRDGAIIRLADGVSECNSVLRTHPRESGPTSADWFMRNIRNLTIDVGNNPNTDGIRYYATNSGIIRNVRVIGNGKIGINAGFLGQSGPNLIQDTIVEGFETGILSQWIWGQTLSRVTIRNCRKEGLVVIANAVGVEDLVVEKTPLAVRCDIPNDWRHWGGVIALVGGRFTGGDPNGPAILNKSVLYARNVKTQGFKQALESTAPTGSITAADIAEYASHKANKLFDDAPTRSLSLPIKPEPIVPWETDVTKWACANEFGAIPGDNKDDTAAIQKAIDAAAADGKTTVYFRGIGGRDPNWYTLNGEVRVYGSVRHVLGLGFGRVLGARGGNGGAFVMTDDSAPVVKFQNIDAFGGPPAIIENRSSSRTMVVESCGVTIVGSGGGEIFATDCPSHIQIRKPGVKVWARHFNPEGTSDTGIVQNAGGDLWALGIKCEGAGVRFRTSDGGRTEILGAFMYDPGNLAADDARPMFDVDNAALSVAGLREITFGKHTFPVKVRQRRGEETRTLGYDRERGWIGWALFSADSGK